MCALVRCLLLVAAVAAAASGFTLGPNDVVFHLYTQDNPSLSQVLFPTPSSILSSNFQTNQRTILTIHGTKNFGNVNAFLVAAHLEVEPVNVIAVDFSPVSSTYTEGLARAEQVGEFIANFINLLDSNFSYRSTQLRIVGVGLGGHIAGIAARQIRGNVPHVVAIDPSLHGWTHHPGRLSPNAADIVEVLHTTSGVQGYDNPLGDLDFYPNGGTHQSGCGIDADCSHTYGVAFYAESVTAPSKESAQFVGTTCEDYAGAISMSCSGPRDAIFGGPEVKTEGSGIYVFVTNNAPPFARD